MKKILTHLTGIVFVITILAAGSCNQTSEQNGPQALAAESETVKIYLKAVKKNGEMHLKMYNSYNRGNKVIDKLESVVPAGSKVIWERTWFNGIKEIKEISSTGGEGNIFINGAKPIPGTKRFMLEIPEDVSPGEEEEYDITFVAKRDNKEWKIDPYLRIED